MSPVSESLERDAAAAPAPTLFGHPKGLSVLFLTGMWEVFAIFGMRTVLIDRPAQRHGRPGSGRDDEPVARLSERN